MKIFGYAVLLFSIAAAPVFAADISIPKDAKLVWRFDRVEPLGVDSRRKDTGACVASSHYPVGSPSLDGHAREFSMSYWDKGGERFSLTFGRDAEATHFVYDTWVYLEDPSELANLEMDINQVLSNGMTVIYAFQCSAYSNTWQYALMTDGPHWHATHVACSPKKWASKNGITSRLLRIATATRSPTMG